jgi:hypothetical protein
MDTGKKDALEPFIKNSCSHLHCTECGAVQVSAFICGE